MDIIIECNSKQEHIFLARFLLQNGEPVFSHEIDGRDYHDFPNLVLSSGEWCGCRNIPPNITFKNFLEDLKKGKIRREI